jgi:hypothetical protein
MTRGDDAACEGGDGGWQGRGGKQVEQDRGDDGRMLLLLLLLLLLLIVVIVLLPEQLQRIGAGSRDTCVDLLG